MSDSTEHPIGPAAKRAKGPSGLQVPIQNEGQIIDISGDDDSEATMHGKEVQKSNELVKVKIERETTHALLCPTPASDSNAKVKIESETSPLSLAAVTSVSTAATPLLRSTLFTEDSNVVSDVATSVPESSLLFASSSGTHVNVTTLQSPDASIASDAISIASTSTFASPSGSRFATTLPGPFSYDFGLSPGGISRAISLASTSTSSPSRVQTSPLKSQSPSFSFGCFSSDAAAVEDEEAPTLVRPSRHIAANFGNITKKGESKPGRVELEIFQNREVEFRTQDGAIHQQGGIAMLRFFNLYALSPFDFGCPDDDGNPQCNAMVYNGDKKCLECVIYTHYEARKVLYHARKEALKRGITEWYVDDKVRDLLRNHAWPVGSKVPCASLEMCQAQNGAIFIDVSGCIECLRALAMDKNNRINGYGMIATFKSCPFVKRISGFREDKLDLIVDTLTKSGIKIFAREDNIPQTIVPAIEPCYSFESWVTEEMNVDDIETLW